MSPARTAIHQLLGQGVSVIDISEALYLEAPPGDRSTKDERLCAHDFYATDDVEIDINALASRRGDDGTWIAAWVWVPTETKTVFNLVRPGATGLERVVAFTTFWWTILKQSTKRHTDSNLHCE
jgi:hypothetical protein